jgi:hypothetical protein
MPRGKNPTLTEAAAFRLFFIQRYRFLTIDQFARIASLNRLGTAPVFRTAGIFTSLRQYQALRAWQEAVSQPDTHGGLERSLIHCVQVKDGNVIHSISSRQSRSPTHAIAVCPVGVVAHILPSHGDHCLRAAFFLELVFRCRFGCADAAALGSSVSSGKASASSSAAALPFCIFALRNVAVFSQGRASWTICRRRAVVSRAASGWVLGMPYLVRYDRLSNPCVLRWRPDNCLKACLQSRQVTACLVMLFRQSTGAVWATGTVVVPISSCDLSAVRVA